MVFDSSETWRSRPIRSARPMRIICIGAGASGLLFAYKLQRSFEDFTLTLYEKNPDIAGTWFENRYPGCACDIPAHTYTWSFHPKNDWSSVYAGSKEIHKYFKDFCDQFELEKYIKLNHKVSKAVWDESQGLWNIAVHNGHSNTLEKAQCDILINATGILNDWEWPAIPGLDSFSGPKLHSAAWDESIVLKGKHVGLIGNGSSGIQILPAILPSVRRLTTFIREPTWVAPVQGLEARTYSAKEKLDFATQPETLLQYRKEIEHSLNSQFAIFLSNSTTQKETRAHMESQMKSKLQNTTLGPLLIPNWSVGCRRLTPGVNYLESLSNEKVTVVYGDIDCISPKGCITSDGVEHAIDVLVCATGFNTSFQPRFPIIGLAGKSLKDHWATDPAAYLGLAAAGFPNYFFFLGPNCPVGNGPVLVAIEAQADYMLKMIDRWQTENMHSFSPKEVAVQDFVDFTANFMIDTVWNQECRSWYKKGSASGRVSALWPGSTLHYLEAMSVVRADDWDIRYRGNRFTWLGIGFSQTEVNSTADLAYYIRNRDDSPYLGFAKQLKAINTSDTRAARSGINIMIQTEKPRI
ncbi:FAD/NAD(P)-binding domain-containing protein [Pyrenochaeta sp. DS3sAY3a]|nr:FAD/NAD(P)-binding domain-containing protein [Pyrenochaeta sp. DS3sAY3a]